jgi:hypothetical protein
MSHIQGEVSAIFDNRTYKGQPSKFPAYKILIGDSEFNAYTNDNLNIKKGDTVSLHFQVSKKTGKTFVESDYETKKLKLQVIPQGQPVPQPVPQGIPEEIPVDDDLSNYEPDHFSSNGVVDNSGTNFNYGANVKKSIDQKSLEMFCMACVKSALESNQLKADKNSIASFIKEMIEVYKQSF